MTENPMVALNRAVACAMVHGPEAGLKLVAELDADPVLAGHYRLDAVRGRLFEFAGDRFGRRRTSARRRSAPRAFPSAMTC